MVEKAYEAQALELGFDLALDVDASLIVCSDKIRALCSAESCGSFGTSWICPPGCGELADCRKEVAARSRAVLVQSIYENVDTSSADALRNMSGEHNRRAGRLFEIMRKEEPDAYLLTTGGCGLCESCTYPDEPCRVPDKRRGSLSAFGINVGELCEKAGMEYSFVPERIRLVACILY